MKTTIYLLPIWIDITAQHPVAVLKDLNKRLVEFFEEYGDGITNNGDSIEVQWSVNEHISLG